MSVLDLMKRRCSVRKFVDEPVPDDLLRQVLEAGRIAPSACNRQPWRFVVVREPALLKTVADACVQDWPQDAPAAIVICGDHRESWRRGDGKDHLDVDVAIAVDHMTLAACDLGLGTCWVCWFDALGLSKTLGLAEQIEPVVVLPIGSQAGEASPDRHDDARKSLDDVAFWDTFEPLKG